MEGKLRKQQRIACIKSLRRFLRTPIVYRKVSRLNNAIQIDGFQRTVLLSARNRLNVFDLIRIKRSHYRRAESQIPGLREA